MTEWVSTLSINPLTLWDTDVCSVSCIDVLYWKQILWTKQLANLKTCLMLVYCQQSEALMTAVILTITNCLPGEVAWAQCDGISCKHIFFSNESNSQGEQHQWPLLSHKHPLGFSSEIQTMLHCTLVRSHHPQPQPHPHPQPPGSPLAWPAERKGCYYGKGSTWAAWGVGELKAGRTGGGQEEEVVTYGLSGILLSALSPLWYCSAHSSPAFTCWSDEVTAGRTYSKESVTKWKASPPPDSNFYMGHYSLTSSKLLAISKDTVCPNFTGPRPAYTGHLHVTLQMEQKLISLYFFKSTEFSLFYSPWMKNSLALLIVFSRLLHVLYQLICTRVCVKIPSL